MNIELPGIWASHSWHFSRIDRLGDWYLSRGTLIELVIGELALHRGNHRLSDQTHGWYAHYEGKRLGTAIIIFLFS
jgi:hypothetical protein